MVNKFDWSIDHVMILPIAIQVDKQPEKYCTAAKHMSSASFLCDTASSDIVSEIDCRCMQLAFCNSLTFTMAEIAKMLKRNLQIYSLCPLVPM